MSTSLEEPHSHPIVFGGSTTKSSGSSTSWDISEKTCQCMCVWVFGVFVCVCMFKRLWSSVIYSTEEDILARLPVLCLRPWKRFLKYIYICHCAMYMWWTVLSKKRISFFSQWRSKIKISLAIFQHMYIYVQMTGVKQGTCEVARRFYFYYYYLCLM